VRQGLTEAIASPESGSPASRTRRRLRVRSRRSEESDYECTKSNPVLHFLAGESGKEYQKEGGRPTFALRGAAMRGVEQSRTMVHLHRIFVRRRCVIPRGRPPQSVHLVHHFFPGVLEPIAVFLALELGTVEKPRDGGHWEQHGRGRAGRSRHSPGSRCGHRGGAWVTRACRTALSRARIVVLNVTRYEYRIA
jgi:hypothetical protein